MGRKKIGEKRREQIIQAFYDCLAETGHESVTVKQIAVRAGLTHGAIHYYFANKDEIIEALVLSLIARYEKDFNMILKSNPTPKNLMPVFMSHFLDIFIFDKCLNRVFVNLTQMSFEREKVRVQMKKLFQAYRSNLKKLNMLAGIEEKRAGILAMGMVALLDGLSLQRAVDNKSVDKESVNKLIAILDSATGLMPDNGESRV
jgi:TetR/AcrR family transcriptional regulator, regulator of biofilm formation and stress response